MKKIENFSKEMKKKKQIEFVELKITVTKNSLEGHNS